MNFPNIISFLRLASVPFMAAFILLDKSMPAFWLFILAGLSDAIDGYLARVFKAHTKLGAYLDPLADKALLVTVYITLAIREEISFVFVGFLMARDVLLIIGTLWDIFCKKLSTIRPLLISKVNTLLQIILAALILGKRAYLFQLDFHWQTLYHKVEQGLYGLVLITTLLSGAAYVYLWFKEWQK